MSLASRHRSRFARLGAVGARLGAMGRRLATGFMLTLGAGLGLLAGCAGTTPVSARADSSAIAPSVIEKRASIDIEVADSPNFYADTSRRRFYGIAGVIAMAVEGNRIVRELAIDDPALHIASELRTRLHNPAASIAAPMKVGLMRAPDDARSAAKTAPARPHEFRLKVRTVTWDFRPWRNDDRQLVIVYAARIELENVRTGEILGSERCEQRRSPLGEVTVERLLADDGKVLREELAAAGRQCLETLSAGPMSGLLGVRTSVARR